jgi:hypothetical protein
MQSFARVLVLACLRKFCSSSLTLQVDFPNLHKVRKMHLRLSRPSSMTTLYRSVSLPAAPLGMVRAIPVCMIFFLVANTCSILLDLIWVARWTDIDQDVEILLLRQQVRILQRKQPRSPCLSP